MARKTEYEKQQTLGDVVIALALLAFLAVVGAALVRGGMALGGNAPIEAGESLEVQAGR